MVHLVACGDDISGSEGDTDAISVGTSSGPTTTGTSGTTGSSSTTVGTSTTGGMSSSSSSSGGDSAPVCNPDDSIEPNNTEKTAYQLPNITDEDGAGGLLESILAGDQDKDWYWYKGTDVAFAYVDPTASLATEMSLRLCIFVRCRVGQTPPVECNNSIDATSPDGGLPGCCNTGKEPYVMIDLTCAGDGDDSADVYMRVDQGYPEKCVPYDLEYHF